MGDVYDDSSVVTTESESEDAVGGTGAAEKGKNKSDESGGGEGVNKKLASLVDVMIGNEEDFTESLGFEVKGLDSNYSNLSNK